MEKIFWTHKNRAKLLNFKNFKANAAHAYLILGPQNIGKSTYAKKIAEIFLCEKNKTIPCGQCHSCVLIRKEQHPDLQIISPQGEKNPIISISKAKEIRKIVESSSFLGGFKVFVIQQAEKLTVPAQNALLKTLEEPVPKTIFLLTTHSEKSILPTILSRCQRIKLTSLSRGQIKDYLKVRHGAKQSELIARYAVGRPGMALKLSENEKAFGDILEKFEEVKKIVKSGSIFYRFKKAEKFSAPELRNQMLDFFEIFFRDLLHLKINSDQFLINMVAREDMIEIAKNYSVLEILRILKNIGKIRLSLLQNINPKSAFENLMLVFK